MAQSPQSLMGTDGLMELLVQVKLNRENPNLGSCWGAEGGSSKSPILGHLQLWAGWRRSPSCHLGALEPPRWRDCTDLGATPEQELHV